MNTAIEIRDDCERCADFYMEKPGAAGPETMIDLYRTIARLAHAVVVLEREIGIRRGADQ